MDTLPLVTEVVRLPSAAFERYNSWKLSLIFDMAVRKVSPVAGFPSIPKSMFNRVI